MPWLIARLPRLALDAWLGGLGFIPAGPEATFLDLLPPQLVVLAGRPVRLAATLVAWLLTLPTRHALATLAPLPLVRALLPLSGPLVGVLPVLPVGVVTRRLPGPGFRVLSLVARCLLGPLIGGWPSPPAPALAGTLR